MNTNTLKVYEIFKTTFGEKEATVVLDYLENDTTEKIEKEVGNEILHLATKEDISEIKVLIADKYANIIKWLFLFWIGTIGTIIAIIKLL